MTRQEYLKQYYQKNKDKIKATSKKTREKNSEKLKEYHKNYRKTNLDKMAYSPQARYKQQKDMAKKRGIPWEFTFDSWWSVWESSGKWEFRGRDGFMMCRTRDEGPYSPNNVRIDTAESNVREMRALQKEH